MKKIVAMAVVAAMVIMTACNSGGKAPATSGAADSGGAADAGAAGKSENKIVFMLNGKLGDQAVNDAFWNGIQKYSEETGTETSVFELAELQDFDATARSYCDKGFNVVICNTSAFSEFVPVVAQEYPDVKFVVMEGTMETELQNILCIRFRIEEAGFISGAFAALMNEELTGSKETAFVGGVRNPDLDRSQFGFAAGARYVGGNSTAVYVGSYTDAAKAKELATQLYSGNIRIIQAWSGGANTGIFEAAKTLGEGYYAMGGATGQFHMSDSILASQVKYTDMISYDACKLALEGEWKPGIMGCGLEDGAVGIKYAPDGRDKPIPQEIKDKIEELKGKVISGEIKVPSTEEEYAEFEASLK